ncbi:MAG: queuosine precursor transporter, partial [Methanoregula sp.]|nr:queuosine precursor transporter [Methanoregula sp.]
MLFWICWLTSLTFVTWFSVYIIRHYRQYAFTVLVAFYIIYLASSQILAARILEFTLLSIVLFAPASVLIYPFIAQVIDMINEVYGVTMTHVAIMIAFVTQVLWVIFITMINSFPAAPVFTYEEAWQALFSMSIRITIASWIAFLICSNVDAFVFDRIKK